MKQTLQLRVGQQLAMTPQLQQAIRLLQLSSLELHNEIQQALESNLMLETDEGEETSVADKSNQDQNAEEQPSGEAIPDELPLDTSWEDIYDASYACASPGADSATDILENRSSNPQGLIEHLLWQVEMEDLTESERLVAEIIVDSIDEDGYLQSSVEEIHGQLPTSIHFSPSDVESILARIQRLDPHGIAARSPAEALFIQLEQLPETTPWRGEAMEIVLNHLERVAEQRYDEIQAELGLSGSAVDETLELIRSLDPRPGQQLSNSAPEYIIPDVTVFRQDGAWHVELNREMTPTLRINPYYASLVKRGDTSADNHCLRTHLQEARWLLKSLQSRNETLLKVASAIVDRQREFMDHGEEAMQPLVLREIAETIDMHESTISRITTNKYMYTPRGTYEFKYFFSSHVSTTDGGEASATAIRARIKRLISAEETSKPLSDSAIAESLRDEGIKVARRTVAKYRESLGIASSSQRKVKQRGYGNKTQAAELRK
ncbi:RNA polymerase factor sigma-54 [Halorhodospira halochloris]|uniref:RNA polymerase sigma-54 factor n=1 Tax=Halorhodospira halochloris TaxID=1052 RepID=A0A0X8XBI7_HALHR|nr:RNA polymerase factor sigma-54 [Halorhodospira halochloris]MBK1651683.1 RNA polymerase factor sigma-54 [Halorhodospira halochloris]MCG5529605.1 RNA polymerase factor sigma-54 [Halorhodospira halochloris]MCG5548116.1 RNA polymerase factor sigma-54 [Halorhodospira halochloris]BAU58547.2 RNA polymerase sigma-54 factor RpoN [Halorhodospira halochloris]